jgi:hypothetical protein
MLDRYMINLGIMLSLLPIVLKVRLEPPVIVCIFLKVEKLVAC